MERLGLTSEPYVLRGEESGPMVRSYKWDPACATSVISEVEEEVLSEYLYRHFLASGVEFCDREVTPHHYPADASPGLPFLQYGIKTKGDVAGAYSHSELCKAGLEQIMSGEIPLYEFAKLEPIKRNKDVRTIMCYPFHVHCALLEKLLAFSEVTKTLKQCKIGWSKWRLGVHDLCESLDRKFVFEADARRFDSTLPNCLVNLALEVYFSMWPEIDCEVVSRIQDAVVTGMVFSSNGEVYYKRGGNPSGNPVTTELNTIVHLLLWALAWYRKYGNLDHFDDWPLYLYGDDVIGSNDGELLPNELSELLFDMPVKYPEENIKISSTPSQLTFLGCTFYQKLGFWLWRPAKPGKLIATLKYTEKCDNRVELGLELARVRGLLLDCAWDQQLWNLLYPYQLVLEREGATEGAVGRHVDRAFVRWLTFGLQGGEMAKKGKNSNVKMASPQKAPVQVTVNPPPRMVGTNGAGQPPKKKKNNQKRKGKKVPVPGGVRNLRITTPSGLKYALAALHPCSENITEAIGFPDDNRVPVHCTRMQRTITLALPVDKCSPSGGSPSVDACSWNLMIISTPWPEYPILVHATKGSEEPMPFTDYLNKKEGVNTFLNGDSKKLDFATGVWFFYRFPNFVDNPVSGVDTNNLRNKYQRLRVVAKGTTTYLNASRLYDGGRVICGQYPVASRFVDTFKPESFGIQYDCLLEKIKKDLNQAAGISCDDFNKHTHPVNIRGVEKFSVKDTTVKVPGSEIVKASQNPSYEANGDLAAPAVQYEAFTYRENTYEPREPCRGCTKAGLFEEYECAQAPYDSCLQLKRVDDKVNHPDWFISEPPVTEDMIFYGDPKATTWEARKGTYQVMRVENTDLEDLHTGDVTFYPLGRYDDREVVGRSYGQTFSVNVNGTGTWGVTYYRNISPMTSVTVKVVQFTEGVVNPNGPYANLTPMKVDPDPAAVELVSLEQQRLAHAYPSNYNDLSSILGEIWKVAKTVGSTIRGVAGSVHDILSGFGL